MSPTSLSRRRDPPSPRTAFARPGADWSDLLEERLVADESQRVLRQAIEALPPASKAVVVLRDIEGLSNPEAAEVLGITVLAVKSPLHRARLALRERLATHFELRGARAANTPTEGRCIKAVRARI